MGRDKRLGMAMKFLCSTSTCPARISAWARVRDSASPSRTTRSSSRSPLRVQCGYCCQKIRFAFLGCSTTRLYHLPDAAAAKKIRPDHLVFLRDEDEARELGFSPAAKVGRTPAAEPQAGTNLPK